ncbi:MAG: enoyl-CoA hydratase/carnithine racemase, partial [Myxococcota bacterium]
MSDILSVHIAEHVATVTIHSPTMPPEYFTALGDAFRALAGNDDVRCVVLRSD